MFTYTLDTCALTRQACRVHSCCVCCCCWRPCTQEAKYRHIRLSNPKIQSSVVQVAGALELLAAVGFEVHAAAQPGSSSSKSPAAAAADDEDDGFAVFLDDSCLDGVQEGLKQLQRALPAALAAQQQYESRHQPAVQPPPPVAASQAGSAAATPSPAAAAPAAASPAALSVPRETQVLLPAVPDTEVPDWFFERTGAEVKAEYLAKMRQRQAGETFASKSWRDAQLGRGKGQTAPTAATVRVRFPEVSTAWGTAPAPAPQPNAWHGKSCKHGVLKSQLTTNAHETVILLLLAHTANKGSFGFYFVCAPTGACFDWQALDLLQ